MKLKFKRCLDIEGVVPAPSSKSYTHRAIILASLAEGRSLLFNPLISEDTLATLSACSTLGAKITNFSSYIEVEGLAGNVSADFSPLIAGVERKPIIGLANSGTSLRLLTSVAALGDKKIIFTGDESLKTRPMNDLLDALENLGVKTESTDGKAPITVYPGFKGGSTKISGNVSSQFISSILISAPLSDEGVNLEVLPEFVSKPYVDMTIDIMDKFSVKVDAEEDTKHNDCNKDVQPCSVVDFKVKPQMYKGCEYTIEGDFSSSSYLLAACGIFGGEITVLNLFKDSKQGDKIIVDILKEMGADIEWGDSSVTIKSDGNLKAIPTIDLSNTPDLLITVAVLASLAEGKTKITGIGHTRFKETDRIATTCEELRKCGCKLEEFEDSIEIEGQTMDMDKEIVLSSHKDHRLAMAFILLGLKGYNITIEDGDVFNVSFPNFIELMSQIGVDLELTY
jgi:3-phosphoshikimate 1-carboxyvinyltransferase